MVIVGDHLRGQADDMPNARDAVRGGVTALCVTVSGAPTSAAPAWTASAAPELRKRLKRPEEVLELTPTRRSLLRHRSD
jgi:hypothetical protein